LLGDRFRLSSVLGACERFGDEAMTTSKRASSRREIGSAACAIGDEEVARVYHV
jgi:hypothetical protein